MEGVQLPDAALHGVIANCKSELAELYAVVQQEQRRKLQRWWVAVGPAVSCCLQQKEAQQLGHRLCGSTQHVTVQTTAELPCEQAWHALLSCEREQGPAHGWMRPDLDQQKTALC
jgi:hypothetical protein